MKHLFPKLICSLIFFLTSYSLSAQGPFRIAGHKKFTKDSVPHLKVAWEDVHHTEKKAPADKKEKDYSFFNENGIGVLVGEKWTPNLKIGLIQYRLKWLTKKDSTKLYIPFYVMSKMTTDYTKNTFSALNDATSLEGGPVTFRITPQKEIKVGLDNVLILGLVMDIRTVAYKDSLLNKLSYGSGCYIAGGASYLGDGEVTDGGQNHEGKWSFSLFVHSFFSKGSIEKNIFGSNMSAPLGFEGMFTFKVIDEKYSKYNLSLGYQREFYTIEGITPSLWKIGISNMR